jgi:hypothetical protein
MLEIRWLESAADIYELLEPKDQDAIQQGLCAAQTFPEGFPLRRSRPFRGYREFVARRRWRVIYRVSKDAIWIRTIYPARAKASRRPVPLAVSLDRLHKPFLPAFAERANISVARHSWL